MDPDDEPAPGKGLEHWLQPIATALLLALIWFAFIELSSHERQETLKAATGRTENLAATLEQYCLRLLKNAEAVTQLVASEYKGGARGQKLLRILKDRAANNDALLEVVILAPDGRLLLSDKDPSLLSQHRLVVPSPFFGDGLVAASPVDGGPDAGPIIPLLRAIRSQPDGAIEGWAAVLVEGRRFAAVFDRARLEEETQVLLGTTGGELHAVWDSKQHAYRPVPAIARDPAVSTAGNYLDGAARLISVRDMAPYSLRIVVGTSQADALRPYEARHNSYLVACALASLFGIALSAAAARMGRRRAQMARRLKRAQEELASLNSSLESEVQVRTAQLEQANRDLQSFSSSVAHDLRGPISSIDGYSHALAPAIEATGDAKLIRYLRRIRENSLHMGEMTEGLLSLARLGQGALDSDHVDLSRTAEDTVAALREREPGRDVACAIHPHLMARGDPALLRQVLENLLGNAWKFLRHTADARIEFGSAGGDEQQTLFFVRDNGPGFDMAHAAPLFKPFHRLHTQQEFPGTGLGLATVARIVRLHDGRVWADAQPGAGATFYFELRR